MLLGLAGALAAALCYGVGSVLQAVAARRVATSPGVDPRLVLRLLRAWPYVAGLALDALGFVLSVAALQTLPLFLVQAVVAGSLAVTAVVARAVLATPLTRTDRAGLVGVVAGLVLLGLSAGADGAAPVGHGAGWLLLVAAVLLGALAAPVGRVGGRATAAALGAVAGLAFGVVAVAARVLPLGRGAGAGSAVRAVTGDPAAYALLVAAVVALVTYATALQRGSVLSATAPLVAAETIAPALVGWLLLGDRARPGWSGVAVVGFVLAVGGALGLARHGEVEVGTGTDPGGEGATPS